MGKLRGEAREYARKLKETLGERLRSVVLHGSVARGEAVEGVSDVNLLVLVDAADPQLLRTLAPRAREWLEKERALPLLFGWDEWQDSMDAFAIETADMLEAREILVGADPLADAVVNPAELRLQAERELRGKLVHLREGMLVAADRPAELGRLLLTALPSVATYLRAGLRLAGRPVPGTTPAVFREASGLLDQDPALLERLWDQRGRGEVPEPEVGDPSLVAVHAVLEATVAYVDTLSGDQR
jgi:predicted nucleotidyltransferase